MTQKISLRAQKMKIKSVLVAIGVALKSFILRSMVIYPVRSF